MADDTHTRIDIDYVARLARIQLTDTEKAAFSRQLDDILNYFNSIKAVDVEGIEPTAHAFPFYNIWQEDEPSETFTPEMALRNAPARRLDQVVVPKVVEDA